MTIIYALVEGQSEEGVIKNVIAPELLRLQEVYLIPIIVQTSKTQKGGDVSFQRLLSEIQKVIKQKDCIVTTFLDFYKLKTDFPDYELAMQKSDIYEKILVLENALHKEVIAKFGCRSDKFIPHIQPHELEALFFSDVDKFVSVESDWADCISSLQQVVDKFESPEHINNSPQTAPSKRLESILKPKYHKTRHAPLLASAIGLQKIENECKHFGDWLNKLRQLSLSNIGRDI